MSDQEIIKKSVTKEDYADDPRGGVVYFMVPYWGAHQGGQLPPNPPQYWERNRDWLLRSTVFHEDMWSAAISIAATKMAALNWEIESEIPLRATRAQEMLLEMDWTTFLYQHLRDFLTTDNGAFIEIVRYARSGRHLFWSWLLRRFQGLLFYLSNGCDRTVRLRKGERQAPSCDPLCQFDFQAAA
jgi:hypothetical protein